MKKYLNSIDNVEIHLGKARSKVFYKFLNKTHMGNHSGPNRWSKSLSLNADVWSNILKSLLKIVCKENKLREFHFKFIHKIIVTTRELLKFGIKNDKEKMTQLTTHSLKALSPGHLQVMFSNGLIQLTLVGSPQQQKKYYLGFLATLSIRK